MKELDARTLKLAKHLSDNRERLMKEHRVKPALFWIGGDPKRLSQWAKKHGLKGTQMSALDPELEGLAWWRIAPKAHTTTVLIRRGGAVLGSRVDLDPDTTHLDTLLGLLHGAGSRRR